MAFVYSYFASFFFFLDVKLGLAAENLVSSMTDLGSKWLMVKLTDKEALRKDQAAVLGHEFCFTHAVFCGSEVKGMCTRQLHMLVCDLSLGILI